MDHAEAIESVGNAPQNELADDPVLRGNSMGATEKSMDDGRDRGGGGGDGRPVLAEDGDLGQAGGASNSKQAGGVGPDESGPTVESEAAETPATAGASPPADVKDACAAVGGHPPPAVDTAERPAFGLLSAMNRDPDAAALPNRGPPTRLVGGPSSCADTDSEAVQTIEVSQAHLTSDNLSETPPPAAIPLEQTQNVSFDDDSREILSDKASSVEPDQPDAEILPYRKDQSQTGEARERAPLESAYGPFIHPTDTSLIDARNRLHEALEQTRLLRVSFTEQAYERYRCVMKPVPESLNEIIRPIQSDPKQAGEALREQTNAIKVEKDTEKKQAHQAGVGPEELAYFGEGLHLVFLPEDEIDEGELDLIHFPHRGPTDPQTGERREEISAAAASTTEQVFDRIRRIRAFRMGAEISPGASVADAVSQMSHNLAQDQQSPNDSCPSNFSSAPLASSPAPSVDSNASDLNQVSSKGTLQHLLTLTPNADGLRVDGNLTAAQSALVAHGVGMTEVKRDFRINSLRQRTVHPHYFSPMQSYKFLPSLLEPHQLCRLQAVDVREHNAEIRAGARESIKTVVEEICSSAGKGRAFMEDFRGKDGSSSSSASGNGALRRALGEERSALEIGLLHRMRLAMLENNKDKNCFPLTPGKVSPNEKDQSINSKYAGSDSFDFDPILAFSVMNAVGLVREKECNDSSNVSASTNNSDIVYAQALGLESLVGLDSVSKFFQTNPPRGNGRKRRLPGMAGPTKRLKKDSGGTEKRCMKDDGVYQIRGGGRQDEMDFVESKSTPNETGGAKNQKKNGVSKSKAKPEAPIREPPLGDYSSFDPLYNAMSQVPLGEKQSQNVIAAAASRQLLQRQLGAPPEAYHAAALAHQLNLPLGSHLSSVPASDIADFYIRNGLAANPDWSALGSINPVSRADALVQHQQMTNSVGLMPGQMNLNLPEQEARRAMLLRDHHNTAVARAHGAATAVAAARYQAALSINPQNPFGFVASSLSQLHSNDTLSVNPTGDIRLDGKVGMIDSNNSKLQRKRSSSVTEKVPGNRSIKKKICKKDMKLDHKNVTKRPASTPPSPRSTEFCSTESNGGSCTNFTQNQETSSDGPPAFYQQRIPMPTPPKGLDQEIIDLVVDGKFHEAHSLSQKKPDQSGDALVKYLLSLGLALPISKDLVADPLLKKLSSSSYNSRLHEFLGRGTLATASRDLIVSVISIWLWAEHRDCFKQAPGKCGEYDVAPGFKWLINLAIDKSLSAIATFFDSHPSRKMHGQTKEANKEAIASIASQSLAKKVFVDNRADASFPILEELLKLLDLLRTDALQAKTQERVFLAALASRCGNMSEAFSNAYVSSIVRAGIALGHENVCEIGQDEECRVSTMLPYDFFHDNVGVWEEPCRPNTGYYPALGGNELKKQAHARSVIQKSMKRLQTRLGLKGGISDGGPYSPLSNTNICATPAPTAALPLVRTPSGTLNRRGSYDSAASGTGHVDTIFNPEHHVEQMLWDPNDISNSPYGHHELVRTLTDKRKKNIHPECNDEDAGNQVEPKDIKSQSTQELEWEDVANMFFHGGSTRNIDINYNFDSNDYLGKKKIFAPFVQEFDHSIFARENENEAESSSDEDISDETIQQRHQHVLDEMKLKLDSALESRAQQRGRKR